jgi:hypothetical protein
MASSDFAILSEARPEHKDELWKVAISAPKTKLLVINPNSSEEMTEAMTANLRKLNLSNVSPLSPSKINIPSSYHYVLRYHVFC